MASINEKLNYINETKLLLKNIINYSGANITNETTFRNYATKLYDGYISVLKDKNTLLDNMPKGTSTGAITDAADLPTYEDKMSKLSTQETTTGKNLFDTRKTSITSNGVTFTPNNDGSITIKGTSTADLNVTLVNTSNPPVLPAGTYRKSIKVVGTITKNNNFCLLTGRDNNNNNVLGDTDVVSNMTTFNKATLEEEHRMTSIGIWTNAGNIVFDCTVYIQIEAGETATEWEKYTGGMASPNPDYPQEVKTVKGNVGITISDGINTRNYTIPLGNNEICGIGDYKDELIVDKNGKCWLNKKTGKVNLSTLRWSTYATNKYNSNSIQNDIKKTKTTVANPSLCEKYISKPINDTFSNGDFGVNSDGVIYFYDNIGSPTGNMYYPLATENPIDLNYTVDTTLFKGINNISNSEDMDMEIIYITNNQ